MNEQTQEKELVQQRLTGSPLILTISIDPHSGEYSIAHNATKKEQFKALANVTYQVSGKMNDALIQLIEQNLNGGDSIG